MKSDFSQVAPLRAGDRVRLVSLPIASSASSPPPLTIGRIYIVRYLDGCCVCTSTDMPGLDWTYHRDRIEKE